jgi:hypothetical protein
MKRGRMNKSSRRKRHSIHIVMLALVMVLFWWGSWKVFDIFFQDSIWSGIAAIIIAVIIYLLDDFKLKELE